MWCKEHNASRKFESGQHQLSLVRDHGALAGWSWRAGQAPIFAERSRQHPEVMNVCIAVYGSGSVSHTHTSSVVTN